ncbi:MAG: VOC family protein [Acidimicrobiia bacterium]
MIDHLVYATPDLEATVLELSERLGTHPVAGGAHVGLGTRNALVSLGGRRYLEIVGPDLEASGPDRPRPFGIDVLDGAALVAWCARSSKPLDGAIAAARAVGHDLGDAVAMARVRPDGVRLDWRLTMPQLVGPDARVVPFLIDWGLSPHPTETLPDGVVLAQLRLAHPDPERLHSILAALDAADDVEIAEGPLAISALVTTRDGVLNLS